MTKFETFEEVKKYLEDRGFQQYTPPDFSHYNNCDATFQKRYDDDIGKKYFIDVLVWNWKPFHSRPDLKESLGNYSISCEGQYYQKGTHEAINMEFGCEIEEVEKFLDNLFELNVLEHYEIWE